MYKRTNQIADVVDRNGREVGWPPEADGGEYSTGGVCCSDVGSLSQCRQSVGQPVDIDVWIWNRAPSGESQIRELEITPRFRKRRRKLDSTAAKEKHRTESLRAVEAESAAGDSSQLVVDTFGASVREPRSEECQNSVSVFLDSLSEFHEGLQPGPDRPGDPTVQLERCVIVVGFIKDSGECFFEQICPVEGSIVTLNFVEFSPLLDGEIPRVFEKDVFCFFDGLCRFGIIKFLEVVDHVASYFVDSLRGELLNVKTVEDYRRIRGVFSDGFDVGRRHIDGNGFEQLRPILAEFVEERIEGVGGFSLSSPDDTFSAMVNHDSDIAMAFPIAELVNANVPEIVQPMRIDVVLDYTIDDVPDGPPRDAHELGDCCLVGNLCQVCDFLLKRASKAAVVPSPRNPLNEYAACRAVRPPRRVFENNRKRGQSKMDPAGRFFTPVVTGANLSAYRASWPKPRRSYGENDTAPGKSNKRDNNTGDLNKNSGKLIHAHVFSGDLSCRGPKVSSEACAFLFCVATLRDCRCLAA